MKSGKFADDQQLMKIIHISSNRMNFSLRLAKFSVWKITNRMYFRRWQIYYY